MYGVALLGGCRDGIAAHLREKETMKKQQIRTLAEHHDNLSDDEEVAEIEAALNDNNETLIMVPTELVPEIVKLINKKRPA
jgi:hypothetical protein